VALTVRGRCISYRVPKLGECVLACECGHDSGICSLKEAHCNHDVTSARREKHSRTHISWRVSRSALRLKQVRYSQCRTLSVSDSGLQDSYRRYYACGWARLRTRGLDLGTLAVRLLQELRCRAPMDLPEDRPPWPEKGKWVVKGGGFGGFGDFRATFS
jgi:hypothetical protein